MTEPTTTLPEPESKSEPDSGADIYPADILFNLVVAFLAPIFLTASRGDIFFARMAAIKTVNGYGFRHKADLVTIAQIIGFGLAALGSLSLSLADDIPISMALRLRGNATACNRAAEQHRRALRQSQDSAPQAATPPPVASDPENDEFNEATVIANVAAAQKRVTQTVPQTHDAAAAPLPIAPPPPAAPASAPIDQQWRAMWAAGMAEVAGEYTASLAGLPPAQRKAATLRAAALSSSANALMSGVTVPPLKPGDLNAIIRPNRP
jgi:DNA-directed RNA polymerase specialized sigma24 family protein